MLENTVSATKKATKKVCRHSYPGLLRITVEESNIVRLKDFHDGKTVPVM
jgi:hypothetical protein